MSTYTPIASVDVTNVTSTVFSSLGSYTDIVVVGSGLTRGTANSLFMRFNSDTGSNYSYTQLVGNGTTASSSRASNQTGIMIGAGTTGLSSTPTMFVCQVQNYRNTNTFKTILSRDTDSNGSTEAFVGLWRNTNAITSIEVYTGGNFTGGTINLYGVANASITNTAKATGGDTITTDGTYWYHTFYSSGTFTPTQALTADYLVVAGGGGGGNGTGNYGGGGGAGGLRCTVTATGGGGSLESALSLTANTNYTVTVGAGGAAGTGTNKGAQGSNSVFSTITSTGGGFGGGESINISGGNGGSGGGRGGGGAGTAGTGTANQGFDGSTAGSGIGGGGGGAGSAASGSTAGSGVAVSISGSSVTYAAGGRGTTGGSAPAANSGGGGLGALSNTAGGSGIIVIRYAV